MSRIDRIDASLRDALASANDAWALASAEWGDGNGLTRELLRARAVVDNALDSVRQIGAVQSLAKPTGEDGPGSQGGNV